MSLGMSQVPMINGVPQTVEDLIRLDMMTAGEISKETYYAFMDEVYKALKDKIRQKQADYVNGAGPFANFNQSAEFGVDPLVGLGLRMGDKFQRFKSFAKQGALQTPGEGIEDVFQDLIGYSFIALAMLKERGHK
jgi:hypothetical protein